MRFQTGIIMGRKSNKHIFEKYDSQIEKVLNFLVEARKYKGIKMNAMAELLEIDPAALSRVEKNQQTLEFQLYLKYCDKLGINPAIPFIS